MKNKIYLFLGSVAVALAVLVVLLGIQLRKTVAGTMISARQLESLKSGLELIEDSKPLLLCDDMEIPYSEEYGIHYLPQVSSGRWMYEMKFTTLGDAEEVYWCEDPYWKDLETAISEGHEFSFAVVNDTTIQLGKMVFTGLPMLSLTKLETLEEDYFYCKVTVLDPFHNSGGKYAMTQCYGYYDLRGKTSRIFPKKGWNLDLVDEAGVPFQMEMMGLRRDDDWKLNALYSDATKVKEAVCMDLWNEIAATTESPYDAGSKMEYFELMVDKEYQGLYGMMEQIDYQQLSLNKEEDVLYKGYNWPEEGVRYVEGFTNRGNYCGQIIKSGHQDITEELWQPMIEYIQATNFDYEEDSVDAEALYKYVLDYMDIENLLNIDLYVQALYASDNLYKNLYIAADRDGAGNYKLWKLPWDLNYTFGEDFLLDEDDRTIYNYEWSEEIMGDFMITEILRSSGNQEFSEALFVQWKTLREGILSTKHVNELAEMYRDKLENSGALSRDKHKWPESPHTDSLEEMLQFHENRLMFLDGHYAMYEM